MNNITVCFLSCKRPDLFRKTFESFWKYCDDIDLIKSVIFDKTSSREDEKR